MSIKINPIAITAVFAFIFMMNACVPVRRLDDQSALTEKYKTEKMACTEELQVTSSKLKEIQERARNLEKQNGLLLEDTSALGIKYRSLVQLNRSLKKTYDQLQSQNQQIVNASAKELQKLNQELAARQNDIAIKENMLAELETSLLSKQENIDHLTNNLKEREAKVAELEDMIQKKDFAVKALKSKITDALKGFSDSDLSVSVKDGKVYISVAENLLFASGSTIVDPKGVEALNKLAAILQKQPDINIVVEGHTDNVAFGKANGPIKDNWDLSVMRATSVLKILTEDNKVGSQQIMAAGRGAYFPIADNTTAEGRAKNRRTEIILSPDLKEIFDILETN